VNLELFLLLMCAGDSPLS